MPFICQIRTDLPANLLQVLDLRPNTSQRSLIYDPPPQSKYIDRVQNDTLTTGVGAGGAILTVAEYRGVGAWLIDNIADTPNGDALTAAQANTIALALIAALDTGAVQTTAAVNAIIAATVAGSGIGVGASTGTLADFLTILAGGQYVLPTGSIVDTDGTTFNTVVSGALTAGQFRHIYDTGSLRISRRLGRLSGFAGATFEYSGTVGAALIVYNDDGTILI